MSQGKMPVALQALWQKNSSGQYVPLARLNTSKSDDVLRALVGALSADQFHGLSADVRRNIQAGARGSKYCLLKSVFLKTLCVLVITNMHTKRSLNNKFWVALDFAATVNIYTIILGNGRQQADGKERSVAGKHIFHLNT